MAKETFYYSFEYVDPKSAEHRIDQEVTDYEAEFSFSEYYPQTLTTPEEPSELQIERFWLISGNDRVPASDDLFDELEDYLLKNHEDDMIDHANSYYEDIADQIYEAEKDRNFGSSQDYSDDFSPA